MGTDDSIAAVRQRQEQQKTNALDQLARLAATKADLKRPVVFVPGWTDEPCVCWQTAYRKGYTPIKTWIEKIVRNPDRATYIVFTEAESKQCRSFLDFAELVKSRVWDALGKRQPFDLVGHSMGGLDAVAAISDPDEPLRQVNNLITVATPHQGSELGQIGPVFKRFAPQHAIQCVNLDPDELPIQEINRLERRRAVLDNIGKLYCLMGRRDQAVMGSARFKTTGLPKALCAQKIQTVEIGGATHSQKDGITQDARVILNILRILLGIDLDSPKKNYGFIYRRA